MPVRRFGILTNGMFSAFQDPIINNISSPLSIVTGSGMGSPKMDIKLTGIKYADSSKGISAIITGIEEK